MALLDVPDHWYRLLVETVRDYAIFMLDPGGHILTWNAGAQRLKGWAAGEILGEHFSIFYGEEDRAARLPERELETASESGVVEMEGWRLRKDGTRFWANVVITALRGDDGALIGFAKVTRDLTERMRAEQALHTVNEKLIAANRELESFSYSVSHDLRAPLRALDGFSQALLEDYGDTIDATGRGYLDRIRNAARRMGQLIDDLLGFSRLGRTPLRPQAIDLVALARSAFEHAVSEEPARDIELVAPPSLPARADERLLSVVLDNLMRNAVKFTRPRAHARIELGARTDGSRTLYFVRDNGVGFDMSYHNKLFQPFQRLHGMNEFEGTGIGLALVQRVIHRHGGQVWAEGRVGDGATIYFTLGLEKEAVDEAEHDLAGGG